MSFNTSAYVNGTFLPGFELTADDLNAFLADLDDRFIAVNFGGTLPAAATGFDSGGVIGAARVTLANVLDQYRGAIIAPLVSDGTDQATTLTAAMGRATAAGRTVLLPPGSFITSPVTVPTGVTVQGLGTTLYIKRQSYSAYSAMISLLDRATLRNVTIDTDDPVFVSARPAFSYNTTGAKVLDCSFNGKFDSAVLFYQCTVPELRGCVINGTGAVTDMLSTLPFRFVEVSRGSGARVRDNTLTGVSQNHAISCDYADNAIVEGNRIYVRTVGGFGIAIVSAARSHALNNDVRESQFEAIQMTLSSDCSLRGNNCSWTSPNGQDFASSVDGCVRCEVSDNKFVNSFKSAVGIAADSADCVGNLITNNIAYGCAVREYAAVPSDPTGGAVFTFYNSTYSCHDNELGGNIVQLDSGMSVRHLVSEVAANSPQYTGSNRIKEPTVLGSGFVLSKFSVQAGCRVWGQDSESYIPVVTGISGGALGPVTNLQGDFTRNGSQIAWRVSFALASGNGLATGGYSVTLPIPARANKVFEIIGREGVSTGNSLLAELVAGYASIRTYNNQLPSGSSLQIYVDGTYEIA